MSPAARTRLQLELDQARTPADAPARKLVALACGFESPLRTDDCERCGAIDWRDCVCDPARPYRTPTPAEIERAREARLTRAERQR